MKLTTFTAALSIVYGALATTDSTITCSSCPSMTSADDIVTRSAVPSVNCTTPGLIISYMTTPVNTDDAPSATGTPLPTETPGSGSKVLGSLGGAVAAAVAVVYMI